MKIRKAVIPAAGFGTRFLPATKAMPKEMLPIVDKPVIQYVVEEAVESGIEDIIIVTGSNKRAIEDHFDHSSELEDWLRMQKKEEQLAEVKRIAEMANFIYIRQKGPYGNATPVLDAKAAVGDEPFAVLWGDEFIWSKPPRLKQMIDVFDKYQDAVISAVRVDAKDVTRYGIAEVLPVEENIYEIKKIVEKPSVEEAPSNLATHGAYIFTPEIFPLLEGLTPGRSGELWLIDAINKLMKTRPVYACEVQNGRYYDTGNKLEYIKANLEFALSREDFNKDLVEYLKDLAKKI